MKLSSFLELYVYINLWTVFFQIILEPCNSSACYALTTHNRWEQIKSYIHFNENSHLDPDDKLHKIIPFIQVVTENFNKILILEKISMDKQVIPFKCKHKSIIIPLK